MNAYLNKMSVGKQPKGIRGWIKKTVILASKALRLINESHGKRKARFQGLKDETKRMRTQLNR